MHLFTIDTCESTLCFFLAPDDRQMPLALLICQLGLPRHQRCCRLGIVEGNCGSCDRCSRFFAAALNAINVRCKEAGKTNINEDVRIEYIIVIVHVISQKPVKVLELSSLLSELLRMLGCMVVIGAAALAVLLSLSVVLGLCLGQLLLQFLQSGTLLLLLREVV